MVWWSRLQYGYSNKKKYITGRGFVETITSIIKSVLGTSKQLMSSAVPALKNIGMYVKENRDLIAKPVLSAVGSLGAVSVLTGVPAILMHIANRNKKQLHQWKSKLKQINQKMESIEKLWKILSDLWKNIWPG